jgi:hypothetical protein
MLYINSLLPTVIVIGFAAAGGTSVLEHRQREPHKHANATGLREVAGYDETKEYPGSSVDGWTITYSVLNGQLNHSLDATAFAIGYTPPASLSSRDQDNSWSSCNRYIFLQMDLDDRTTVDPECRGIISDSCRSALSRMAESNEACKMNDMLPECRDEFKNGHAHMDLWRAAGTITNNIFKLQYHNLNDFTLYDIMLKSLLITVTAVEPSPDSGLEDEHLRGSLSCVHATAVKEGSRIPHEEGKPVDDKEDQPVNDGDSDQAQPVSDEEPSKAQPANDGESSKEDPKQGAASALKLSLNHIATLVATVLIANWI